MDREHVVQVFFFAFLALMTYELYDLLSPFFYPIAWAILLAFVAHPVLLQAQRLTKSRTLAAILVTFGVALVVIIPAVYLSSLLAAEAQTLYTEAGELLQSGALSKGREQFFKRKTVAYLNEMLVRRGFNLEDEIPRLAVETARLTSSYLATHLSGVAKNLLAFVVDFAIVLLTLFYLLRDGEQYYESLRAITPLHEDDKAVVYETLGHTLSAVMRGLMLAALAQGIFVGIGYVICGVPYSAVLAIITAAAGLVPLVGTALVWLPVAAYVAYSGSWGYAIGLFIWSAAAVAVIDNFLKPMTMRHGTKLPTVVLFFAIAGGLAAYGPIGLFAGPAIISIFAALLRVYRRTYGVAAEEHEERKRGSRRG